MSNRKFILVTGGTGFIGSNLLARLEQEGYNNVICIDSFDDNKWQNVAHRNMCIRYYLPSQTEQVLSNYHNCIKAVIHLGAISSTTASDVNKIVTSNIQLSIYLYEFCKKHKIQFIYASSAATYGDGQCGFKDDENIDYLSLLRPLNPYAWSKLCVDKYIFQDYATTLKDFQIVGLKFFNVYGPNEYHKGAQASVIFHFFNQIKATQDVKLFASNNHLFKNGEQNRDFVHVNDCVNVIVWFLHTPNASGLFNVGTGISTTFNEIATKIIKKVNNKCRISYINIPDNVSKHYQNHTLADMSKLRSCGYRSPFISIEEGLNAYLDKLNSNDQYL